MASQKARKRLYAYRKVFAVFAFCVFAATAAFVFYIGVRDNNTVFLILPFVILAFSAFVCGIIYCYAKISFLAVNFDGDAAVFTMSDGKPLRIPCKDIYYVNVSRSMRRALIRYKKGGKNKALRYDISILHPEKDPLNMIELKCRLICAEFVQY